MKENFLLEISAESLGAAVAAERAGAARVELCSNLQAGGVTPAPGLLRQVRAALKIPVFSIIRPRAGNFVYDESELTAMTAQIAKAREIGADGVVLGVLRPDDSVDVPRTKELVDSAKPLPVTFHRAFDHTKDFLNALEDVITTGARRLLTSGGADSVSEGLAMLLQLLEAAAERIIVMPGRGLNEETSQRCGAPWRRGNFILDSAPFCLTTTLISRVSKPKSAPCSGQHSPTSV